MQNEELRIRRWEKNMKRELIREKKLYILKADFNIIVFIAFSLIYVIMKREFEKSNLSNYLSIYIIISMINIFLNIIESILTIIYISAYNIWIFNNFTFLFL
jgi:hypothetical protein